MTFSAKYFGLLSLLLIPMGIIYASPTAGDIDTVYKYAWGENIGWLNFRAPLGNVVVGDSALTGDIWSQNYGWIRLDPVNAGVTNDGEGNLGGDAWAEGFGYIDFSGVTIDDAGYFHGTATSDFAGDIILNCEDVLSCDTYNYKVKTDWVKVSNRVDIVGSVRLSDPVENSTNVKYTLAFTPSAPIPNNGTIVLTFPSDYTASFASLTNSDIAVSSDYLRSSDITVDTGNRIIRIEVEAITEIVDEVVIVIGDGLGGGFNDLTNPSNGGNYGIGLDIFDATDDEMSNGIAYAQIANTSIDIGASILEALNITINATSLSFNADPAINDGKDISQYTELVISSNALNGYKVYGALNDGNGNAQLADGPNAIPSGTGDGSIGYEARNAAYDMGESVDADSAFSSSSTLLNSNGTDIEFTGPTNSQSHTIYYDIDINFSTPPGNYQGTVTYTVSGGF